MGQRFGDGRRPRSTHGNWLIWAVGCCYRRNATVMPVAGVAEQGAHQLAALSGRSLRYYPSFESAGRPYFLGFIMVTVVSPAIPSVGKCARIVSAT